MKNGKHIHDDGSEYWYRNGEWHRYDGPAITYSYGTKCWYQDGKCHRDNGPASIYADGTEYWYRNGELHRDDGPAITHADGSEEWYQNDIQLTESQILILKEKIGFDKMMKDLFTCSRGSI